MAETIVVRVSKRTLAALQRGEAVPIRLDRRNVVGGVLRRTGRRPGKRSRGDHWWQVGGLPRPGSLPVEFGHAFLTLGHTGGASTTRGFYPDGWNPQLILRERGPGAVWDDSARSRDGIVEKKYCITKDQYESALEVVERHTKKPYNWEMPIWNCVDWVGCIAGYAGLKSIEDAADGAWSLPSQLADAIRADNQAEATSG